PRCNGLEADGAEYVALCLPTFAPTPCTARPDASPREPAADAPEPRHRDRPEREADDVDHGLDRHLGCHVGVLAMLEVEERVHGAEEHHRAAGGDPDGHGEQPPA